MSEKSVLMRLQGLHSGRMLPLDPSCYATKRDHFQILKHTATNALCRLIAV